MRVSVYIRRNSTREGLIHNKRIMSTWNQGIPYVWFFTYVVPHSPLEALANMHASMIWVSFASSNGLSPVRSKAVSLSNIVKKTYGNTPNTFQSNTDRNRLSDHKNLLENVVRNMLTILFCFQCVPNWPSISAVCLLYYLSRPPGSIPSLMHDSQVFSVTLFTTVYNPKRNDTLLNTSWLQIRFWYKSNSLRTTQKCHIKYEWRDGRSPWWIILPTSKNMPTWYHPSLWSSTFPVFFYNPLLYINHVNSSISFNSLRPSDAYMHR